MAKTKKVNKEAMANAGSEALAAIEKIQAEAKAKMQEQLDGLNDAISAKRSEVRAKEKELDELLEIKASITGHATAKTSGGGTGTRLKKHEIAEMASKIPSILSSAKSLGEVATALGIKPVQARSILKSHGKKVEMHGSRNTAKYTWSK